MAVKIGLKYIDIWKESMEDAVLEYEKEKNNTGEIVFYGPSNFTRWSARFGMKPMRDVLLGGSGKKCVINRGFGSTGAEHQLYYYPRMVRPLAPRVLVYSPFGNNAAFGYSIEEAWEIAQRVIVYAETDFPGIEIYVLAPNVRKADFNEVKMRENERISATLEAFCSESEHRHALYPLSYAPLASRKDIFVEDGVHFNQAGYDIYAEFFKEVLKDELAKY